MRRSVIFAIALLLLAACAREDEPGAMIDRLAAEILQRDPAIVIMNEAHRDHRTRYVSACLLEALGRRTQVGLFGAETLAGRGVIEADDQGRRRLSGPYVNKPHFADLAFTAARLGATPFAYDTQSSDDDLTGSALRSRGLTGAPLNARDRFAAEQIVAVRAATEVEGLTYLHVGNSHGATGVDEQPDGLLAVLGGQLILLEQTPLVSVTQTARPGPEQSCEASGDVRAANFLTGRIACVEDPGERLFFFDFYMTQLALAVNEDGYVKEVISGCGVRKPVWLEPPIGRFAGDGDMANWRIEVRQGDGFGQRVVTWSGNFIPGETRPFLLDTQTADLTWIGTMPGREPRSIFIDDAPIGLQP